jgi:hypothetical protein
MSLEGANFFKWSEPVHGSANVFHPVHDPPNRPQTAN